MSKEIKEIIKKIIPKTYVHNVRERMILKKHKKVADFWNPVIDTYLKGGLKTHTLQPQKNISTPKIIWQYWGQGIKNGELPEIVQICFASVDKYKGNYEVIRLTDDSINDFIKLPDFVWEKRKNKAFNRTFFSDLLRLALLQVYGGVWLDATVLLTGQLPASYESPDYFAFQRSDEEKNKQYWENVYAYYFGWHPDFKVRFLSSIIFAKPQRELISALLDLMLFFWETQDRVPDYFCFQILYNELVRGPLAKLKCPVVNDCIPHIIQTKINGSYNAVSFKEALSQSTMHKMAYFNEAALVKLKNLLAEKEIL